MGFSRFGSSGEIRTSWAYHISAKSINSDFWLWRSGFFHFKSRHPFLLLPNGPPALPTYSRILTYIDLWYYCVYEYLICILLKSNKSIYVLRYSLVQIRLKNINYWALSPYETDMIIFLVYLLHWFPVNKKWINICLLWQEGCNKNKVKTKM